MTSGSPGVGKINEFLYRIAENRIKFGLILVTFVTAYLLKFNLLLIFFLNRIAIRNSDKVVLICCVNEEVYVINILR